MAPRQRPSGYEGRVKSDRHETKAADQVPAGVVPQVSIAGLPSQAAPLAETVQQSLPQQGSYPDAVPAMEIAANGSGKSPGEPETAAVSPAGSDDADISSGRAAQIQPATDRSAAVAPGEPVKSGAAPRVSPDATPDPAPDVAQQTAGVQTLSLQPMTDMMAGIMPAHANEAFGKVNVKAEVKLESKAAAKPGAKLEAAAQPLAQESAGPLAPQGIHKADGISGASGDTKPAGEGNTTLAVSPHSAAPATSVVSAPQNTAPAMPVLSAPVDAQASAGDPVKGNELAGNQQANAGSPLPGTEAQPLPAINTARVIQSLQGTEMRVGMHSAEFGSLSVSTLITRQSIAAQISFEHADLGRALAAHLPAMEAKLSSDYGVRASVGVRDQSVASESGERSSEGRKSQSGSPSGSPVRNSVSSQAAPSAISGVAPGENLRLDIRI